MGKAVFWCLSTFLAVAVMQSCVRQDSIGGANAPVLFAQDQSESDDQDIPRSDEEGQDQEDPDDELAQAEGKRAEQNRVLA